MVDYTIWDLRRAFTAREAAHLWFEIDPNENEIPDDVKLKIKPMEGVIDQLHRFPYIHFDDDPFPPDKFTREELKAYAEEREERPPFLFPEERKSRHERHDINKQAKGTGFTHSPDFRSINKDGKIFELTPAQAQVVKILWKAKEVGTPALGRDYIIEQVSPDTSIKRIREYFRKNPEAFKALIESGSKKGTVRLKI
jgi:hypothetical protein